MPVESLASIFDDDVGVRLEDRDDLCCRGDGLIVEDSALGLIDDFASQLELVL